MTSITVTSNPGPLWRSQCRLLGINLCNQEQVFARLRSSGVSLPGLRPQADAETNKSHAGVLSTPAYLTQGTVTATEESHNLHTAGSTPAPAIIFGFVMANEKVCTPGGRRS